MRKSTDRKSNGKKAKKGKSPGLVYAWRNRASTCSFSCRADQPSRKARDKTRRYTGKPWEQEHNARPDSDVCSCGGSDAYAYAYADAHADADADAYAHADALADAHAYADADAEP